LEFTEIRICLHTVDIEAFDSPTITWFLPKARAFISPTSGTVTRTGTYHLTMSGRKTLAWNTFMKEIKESNGSAWVSEAMSMVELKSIATILGCCDLSESMYQRPIAAEINQHLAELKEKRGTNYRTKLEGLDGGSSAEEQPEIDDDQGKKRLPSEPAEDTETGTETYQLTMSGRSTEAWSSFMKDLKESNGSVWVTEAMSMVELKSIATMLGCDLGESMYQHQIAAKINQHLAELKEKSGTNYRTKLEGLDGGPSTEEQPEIDDDQGKKRPPSEPAEDEDEPKRLKLDDDEVEGDTGDSIGKKNVDSSSKKLYEAHIYEGEEQVDKLCEYIEFRENSGACTEAHCSLKPGLCFTRGNVITIRAYLQCGVSKARCLGNNIKSPREISGHGHVRIAPRRNREKRFPLIMTLLVARVRTSRKCR
jgi:cell division protein ZapA (FtsZ GTPase activity inhibitor)